MLLWIKAHGKQMICVFCDHHVRKKIIQDVLDTHGNVTCKLWCWFVYSSLVSKTQWSAFWKNILRNIDFLAKFTHLTSATMAASGTLVSTHQKIHSIRHQDSKCQSHQTCSAHPAWSSCTSDDWRGSAASPWDCKLVGSIPGQFTWKTLKIISIPPPPLGPQYSGLELDGRG